MSVGDTFDDVDMYTHRFFLLLSGMHELMHGGVYCRVNVDVSTAQLGTTGPTLSEFMDLTASLLLPDGSSSSVSAAVMRLRDLGFQTPRSARD